MARGSVFKRNGAYGYRADLGPDPATGKRRQPSKQGFRTKREADTALAALLAKARAGGLVAPDKTKLDEYLNTWLYEQQSRLKATTWESYRIAIARVNGQIGKLRLQGLSPAHIHQLYTDLSAHGGRNGGPLSGKSVRNTHVVLRKALGDAERLELIGRNPAAVVHPPSSNTMERDTWTSSDLQDFFAAIKDDRLFALWVLYATTGMRRGEVLGLRWKDIDFDSGDLRIVQTLTTVDYQLVFETPKSKRSRRALYLDEQTMRVLKAHRVRQKEEQLRAGEAWDKDSQLVFTDEMGAPLHPDKMTRRFRTLVRPTGLTSIRLHDLRHTYATLALKSGVHPKVVSERLGHASVGITLDLYSHVTPGIGREAADTVAARIFGQLA